MKIKIKLDDPKTRAIFAAAERAVARVAAWPAWKRGEMKHWYHVKVELPDKRTFLIAIEATSKLNAAVQVAQDWGKENLRKVERADGTDE